MSGRKRSKKESQWRDIVNRQESSGLSVRQFCAGEQISEPSFYAWRRRLRDQEASAARSRAGCDRAGVDATNGPEFIPLQLLDAPAAWEVIHPHGYRVRVSGEMSATALQCILGVLDGRVSR